MALTNKLTAIADAIREKGGTTEKLTLDAMAAAIAALETGSSGGSEGEEDVKLHWEGDLGKWNYYGLWDWYFNKYKNQITTGSITYLIDAFNGASELEELPFDFNSNGSTKVGCGSLFMACKKLKTIGAFNNIVIDSFTNAFNNCHLLRYLPEFNGFSYSPSSSGKFISMFQYCYSLREIPEDFLNKLYNGNATSSVYSNVFNSCYTLDEIVGLSPRTGVLTSNQFSSTFSKCYRLKRLVFDTQEDGTPYIVSWQKQSIDLYSGVGWLTGSDSDITGYNSGITADKKIIDVNNYPTLKDDPDCYTGDVYFSRFNKTSAVELINSLPDASAYLATQSGGTNTIKFRQDAGGKTDGGQIGNLTEEEVAVATAKGWAISYAV